MSAATVRTELVPFHDDTIVCGHDGNGPDRLIAFRPTCDAIGLPFKSQHERLLRQPWATVRNLRMVAEDGKSREMTFIDRRTFAMWLATINVDRLGSRSGDPERYRAVADKIALYQREASDVLDRHFFGLPTPAVDPRVQAARMLLDLTEKQVEQEHRLEALESRSAAMEAKADAALAQATGDTGWMTALGFTRLRGLRFDRKQMAIVGRRLSALCRAEGIAPGHVYDEHYGEINSYPLELLEQWWEASKKAPSVGA